MSKSKKQTKKERDRARAVKTGTRVRAAHVHKKEPRVVYAHTMEGYFITSMESIKWVLKENIATDKLDKYDQSYIDAEEELLQEIEESGCDDSCMVAVVDETFYNIAGIPEKLQSGPIKYFVFSSDVFFRIHAQIKMCYELQTAQVFGRAPGILHVKL